MGTQQIYNYDLAYADSDYPFGIFKFFLLYIDHNGWQANAYLIRHSHGHAPCAEIATFFVHQCWLAAPHINHFICLCQAQLITYMYLSLYYLLKSNTKTKEAISNNITNQWPLLDLQPPAQSVTITTNVLSSNLVLGEVYSIQHYVIKLVSDL